MQQWEYAVLKRLLMGWKLFTEDAPDGTRRFSVGELTFKGLNQLGKEGWELAGVNAGGQQYVFKRPRSQDLE
jgi:hypothetical protein